MDSSFIMVCLLVVGIVFIPFYLFGLAGKTEAKKNKTLFAWVISKHNLHISTNERWGNKFLGLDSVQGKLVYLEIMSSGTVEKQLLELERIATCRIVEQRKFIKVNSGKESLLEKLDMELSLKDGEVVSLNFYDLERSFAEDYEMKRAEKWKAIVEQAVADSPSRTRVA